MDDVYYNIAAIKAYEDNMIKYITFREKLPKVEIAVHGHTFELWNENEKLPEMAPFNMDHTVHEDVLNYQSRPQNMEDKLGKEDGKFLCLGEIVILACVAKHAWHSLIFEGLLFFSTYRRNLYFIYQNRPLCLDY